MRLFCQRPDLAVSMVGGLQLTAFMNKLPDRTLFRRDYPQLLSALGQLTPSCLHVRGHPEALGRSCIAIVGSRDATDEAAAFAERLGQAAADVGLCVVSGAARGIDTAAHGGALKNGGTSVAVLGRPLDEAVPYRTRAMFKVLIEQGGCLVSERPAHSGFHPSHYVQRNRIIAGLAEVTVVVSAQIQSGALSTASWARQFGRAIWAVPAGPWEIRAQGTNYLLAKGARQISSIQAFREALAEHFGVEVPATIHESDRMLAYLRRSPCDVQQITLALGAERQRVLSELLRYEVAGRVRRLHDGRYAYVH
jgi:DNA processing protein